MKPKTLVLMFVAVACGLAASYMTSRLLAERSNKEQAAEEKVKVLVAKKNLALGYHIKNPEDVFEERQFTKGEEPKKAVKSFDQLKDRRLNKSVAAEQWLSADDLMDKNQDPLASQMPKGMRAFGLKVNAESTSGGFVLPNSRVDVVWVARRGDQESTAKIILQNVLVMAVDLMPVRPDDKQAHIANTVTLALTPEQSERLSLATEMGTVKLVLRPFGDEEIVRSAGATNKTIARGGEHSDATGPGAEDPEEPRKGFGQPKVEVPATPPKPAEAPKPEEPKVEPPPKTHTLTVFNGENVTKAVFVLDDNNAPTDARIDQSQPDRGPARKTK